MDLNKILYNVKLNKLCFVTDYTCQNITCVQQLSVPMSYYICIPIIPMLIPIYIYD